MAITHRYTCLLFIVFALISAYSPAPGGGSRGGGI